jgi:serine/threonine-protein kinase
MSLTKTSALVGSPIYMSPEQLNSSKDVDGRTDIWALGIILYELVTGRTPFYGESIPQLVNSVLNTEPDTFTKLGINAPAGLEQVVRRTLSKSRDTRIGSAQELYQALAPFAAEPTGKVSGVQSQKPPLPTRSMSVQDGRPSSRPSSPAPTPSGATKPATQKRPLRTAALVVFLIAAAGVAALLSRRSEGEPNTSQGPAPAALTPPPSSTAAPAPPENTPPLAPVPEQPVAAEPSAEPAAVDAASAVNQPAPAAIVAPPRETSDARRRERTRSGREPAPPVAAPAPKPDSHDDSLPNFGGRR